MQLLFEHTFEICQLLENILKRMHVQLKKFVKTNLSSEGEYRCSFNRLSFLLQIMLFDSVFKADSNIICILVVNRNIVVETAKCESVLQPAAVDADVEAF